MSPSGPLLERDDLARGAELCRALGLEPRLAAHAGGRHGYLAGTDEERLADLNAALLDDGVDAVWCLRGGYGMTRILDGVEWDALSRRPKAVLGYSDITSLVNAIPLRARGVAFHGPVARTPLTEFSRRHLERVLCGDAPASFDLPPSPAGVLVPRENRVVTLVPGVAEGPLVGGNLTLLQCLVGTPYQPELDGAILFLEDVNEDLYRVDRMLAHLRMAGLLARIAGAVIGRFTEMPRNTGDGAMGFDEVLETYLSPLGIPVAYGLPIGHVDDQWTLPVGVRARWDAGTHSLTLLEPAVL
ncbi:MAG: LD-carboxypeptidase [Candidatus Rokubacteria bacterium]|nr:LD-carboxypeptidase [Candidatus Rokubacteria bacterium]